MWANLANHKPPPPPCMSSHSSAVLLNDRSTERISTTTTLSSSERAREHSFSAEQIRIQTIHRRRYGFEDEPLRDLECPVLFRDI